ncbi:MAG TPA: hypothetical protein VJP78_01580 [Thermoleophilia bacterium]|nr:hypothetical protein [Thermoleophilia bacterium]
MDKGRPNRRHLPPPDFFGCAVGALLGAAALVYCIMATGCTWTHQTGWKASKAVTVQQASIESKPCYETAHGLIALAHDGECPSQKIVEQRTRQLLRWVREEPDSRILHGVNVIFTPYVIAECDHPRGGAWLGCVVEGKIAFVRYLDWPLTLQHEELHVFFQRSGAYPKSGDRHHFDWMWKFYRL